MTVWAELNIDPDEPDICWLKCPRSSAITRLDFSTGPAKYMRLCHEHNQVYESPDLGPPYENFIDWPWQPIYRLVKDNPQA